MDGFAHLCSWAFAANVVVVVVMASAAAAAAASADVDGCLNYPAVLNNREFLCPQTHEDLGSASASSMQRGDPETVHIRLN